MKDTSSPYPKIYDPQSGRIYKIDRLIDKLGVQVLAKKFNVSESSVQKWRKGVHKPSRKTLSQAEKKLF